jgi:microcystin-dependent protein
MAITSFPFDGQDTTEDQYSRLFSELQDNGVAATPANALTVSADGSTLVVAVSAGFAILRGHGFVSSAVENLTVPLPTSGTATHRIILRLDPAANAITLEVLEGTPGAGAPALTQDATGVFEISLARVQVSSGAAAIGQSDVQDERSFLGTRVQAWQGAAQRPAAPRAGQMGYNLSTKGYEFFNGLAWEGMAEVPTATVQMSAAVTTPAGYLPCDGGIYDSTVYPDLAAALGTTFSIPEDSPGTFRTPNMVGAFPLGASGSHELGSQGGSESKVVTEDNLPEHTHPIDHDHGMTAEDGNHDHGYRYSTEVGSHQGTFTTGRFKSGEVREEAGAGVLALNSEHEHVIPPFTGASGTTGGGVPLDIMPPYIALNFIIKT